MKYILYAILETIIDTFYVIFAIVFLFKIHDHLGIYIKIDSIIFYTYL